MSCRLSTAVIARRDVAPLGWIAAIIGRRSAARRRCRRCILGHTASAALLLVIGFASEGHAEGDSHGATMMAERPFAPAGKGVRTGQLEEQAVCGFWTERLLSVLYHLAAGRPDATRVRGIPGLERVTFMTRDGRQLGGYKLRAYADERRQPHGYVLVALGNAMLADQVVGAFRFLQADGFDVHVYDYRGYGLSEGRSRFFAIRADHIDLIEHLNGAGYRHRFLYGMSLGGVFLLNAIGAGVDHDATLIDSAPSRISGYGCPQRFDPVENLPRDGARLGFVFGHRDTVVPPGAWRELSETARARGALVFERAELAHPLMDVDPSTRQARFDLVRQFFAGRVR
jgi:pimeloyl-ACP methyl ester carboxylesterase